MHKSDMNARKAIVMSHDDALFIEVAWDRLTSINGTVSMAAAYQLKIKYDQDKFGVVLW